jgi:hypothetical protein
MWRLDQRKYHHFFYLMHWGLTLFFVMISFQTIPMVLYAQNEKIVLLSKVLLNGHQWILKMIFSYFVKSFIFDECTICAKFYHHKMKVCPPFYKHPIKMHNALTNIMAIVMCSNCKQMWWTFPFIYTFRRLVWIIVFLKKN